MEWLQKPATKFSAGEMMDKLAANKKLAVTSCQLQVVSQLVSLNPLSLMFLKPTQAYATEVILNRHCLILFYGFLLFVSSFTTLR